MSKEGEGLGGGKQALGGTLRGWAGWTRLRGSSHCLNDVINLSSISCVTTFLRTTSIALSCAKGSL